ncbi:unnamed protein product [Prorocentrum cordatum]|uniref:Uncharacterized protein n=1 Tax=Prorocentrum cordatum TaxID=2364126 RepID=A0ABN9Q5Z0_9DINO|nr:unnamed protein product [Polarella glacialis]
MVKAARPAPTFRDIRACIRVAPMKEVVRAPPRRCRRAKTSSSGSSKASSPSSSGHRRPAPGDSPGAAWVQAGFDQMFEQDGLGGGPVDLPSEARASEAEEAHEAKAAGGAKEAEVAKKARGAEEAEEAEDAEEAEVAEGAIDVSYERPRDAVDPDSGDEPLAKALSMESLKEEQDRLLREIRASVASPSSVSAPIGGHRSMGSVASHREPIGKASLLFSNPHPESKEELIQAIDNEIGAINDELQSHTNPDERTMEHLNVRLSQVFQAGLVQKLAALKKADPNFDCNDMQRSNDSDGLSAKDKQEKSSYGEMEKHNYMFSTGTKAGNAASGRWRRALDASEELRKQCAKEKGWMHQRRFRRDWLMGNHAEWKESVKHILVESNEKEDTNKCGGTSGLRLALKHASNAMLLGGIWTRWDDMAGAVEYLNIRHQLIESFKKQWIKHKEWVCPSSATVEEADARAARDEGGGGDEVGRAPAKGEKGEHKDTTDKKDKSDKKDKKDKQETYKKETTETEATEEEGRKRKKDGEDVRADGKKDSYDWCMAQHAKLDGFLKLDAGWKGVERMRESMGDAMKEATRGGVTDKCHEHNLSLLMTIEASKYKKQVRAKACDAEIQLASGALTACVQTLSSEIRILMNQEMARDDERGRLQQEGQAKKDKESGASAKKKKEEAKKAQGGRKKAAKKESDFD